MTRARPAAFLVTAFLLLTGAGGLEAQTVQDPLVPRGSLVFRTDPVGTVVEGIYGPDGEEVPLGGRFRFPSLGAAQIPSLGPVQERFSELALPDESFSLDLGATEARFSLDERVLPLRLSLGVLDRLTIGVTVPFVKKRIESQVRLAPEGANVGRNPAATGTGEVQQFLTQAEQAFTLLQSQVDATCTVEGEGSAECLQGRELVGDTDAFLGGLSGAYDEEVIFPLDGSALGMGITARWVSLTQQFAEWNTEAPDAELPLAASPLNQEQFRSLYLAPAWGTTGFPTDAGDPVLALGDVEAHVAVGLLRPSEPEADGPMGSNRGLDIVASAVGTVRFATGGADSLHVVAPLHPPRGVPGFGLRLITDLLIPDRFAVLGILDGGWNGSAETTILAPDPNFLFTPGFTRTRARWTPGSHIRATVAPRYQMAPGLSLGVGWYFLRREGDEYESLEDDGAAEGPALPAATDAYSQHRLGLELRYVAMRGPIVEEVPFPFEVLLRASRTVAGSVGAPVETQAEAMIRFRLRDWGG